MIIGIPIGVYAALRQDTIGDYILRTVSILALAIPGFWIGTLVWCFPASGGVGRHQSAMSHCAGSRCTPGAVTDSGADLGKAFSAVIMRLTRTMMLEVLRQDYIRTACAKGLPVRTIMARHALRNALIPVVTLVGLLAPVLFGGAVIMEQIFVIPGMGLLLLEAVGTGTIQ